MMKPIATTAVIAVGYFLLGLLGLSLAIAPGYATIIWPASGLALVAAIFYPKPAVFGVFLGAFFVNITNDWLNTQTASWAVAVCIGLTVVLQSSVAAYLVKRYVGIPFLFHRTRLVWRFVVLAGFLSCLIGATLGTAVLLLFGLMAPEEALLSGLVWWGGDVIGVLVVVPWLAVIFPALFGQRFEHPWRLIGGFSLVLVVTVLLSWGSAYSEWNKQTKEFRSNAQLLEVLLNNRIKNSVDMLYSLVGLIKSSDHMRVKEFETFAQRVVQRDSSILSVSLNFAVAGDDLNAFERSAQLSYPEIPFRITESARDGEIVPVTPRPKHIVVTYIHPLETNKVALGYDLYSQPDRRFAVDQAIAFQQAYPTSPLSLLEDTKAVILFLPFFDDVQKETFLGVAIAVIEVETLTETIVEYGRLPNTELYLVDEDNASPDPIIVAKSKSASLSAVDLVQRYQQDDFQHAVSFDINVGAKAWRLYQVSDSRFFKQPWVVKFVLACGFLFTGAFGWFLLIVSGHTAEIESRVTLRTRDLLLANDELKASELEQSKAKEEAVRASHAKSAFLATMSHEIRTPLNGVIGCLALLMSTRLQPKQQELAKLSQQSAESLLDIINDILDLSKIEVGNFVLEKQAFSLPELVEEVTHIFVLKAEEKGIVLNSTLDAVPNVTLLGDRLRIKQILVNLLGNAVKFTQQGEVSLHLSLTQQKGQHVMLDVSVKDTGIGISKENQAHLFQRFNQADSSTTRRFGGTGLGLAISKEFIDAMNGHISLTSEHGVGSNFTCRIPLALVSNSEADRSKTSATKPQDKRHNERPVFNAKVLLVEDNLTNQIVARGLLKLFGIEVVVAENGQQAVEKADAQCFDLIFMDCQMPVMDGYEATRTLRQSGSGATPADVAIVALSANAMKGDKETCIAAGMDDHIAKPISQDKLEAVLTKWLP
ncbi:ATP-binding protein [Marinomonas algarum]|uniref:Sensory/regulatory protein RpfC n=1 Tax=Marinomonas algarum TaxID=2883105 RepID=A0A9X1LC45_9GAMM|nr:ATP-binding protein [Marinomonas algarum]MCB5161112.1 CHASE domain-containing protein [Marinomonas algarum]